MTALLLIAATVAGLVAAVLGVLLPRATLLVLVGLDVTNISGVVADHVGTSPFRPLLALAALSMLTLARRGELRLPASPVVQAVLVLYAGLLATLLVTVDPSATTAVLLERGRDVLYFLVVYTLLCSTRAVVPVARATVLALAALALLTVVQEFVLHNSSELFGLSRVPLVREGGALTARHAGTSSDVNFWGRLLVLFLPLALAMFAAARARRQDRTRAALYAVAAVALLLGVYLTQSRGGFLAAGVTVLVWLLLAGPGYRRALLAVPLVLTVAVPLTGIGSRLATLAQLTAGGARGAADPSLVTRARLQGAALRMFLDRPLLGQGVGTYGTLFPRYDRHSNVPEAVDIVVAPHNFFLEQAADGGLMLLLCWALLFTAVAVVAVRAAVVHRRAGHLVEANLAVGALAGLAGWLVASIFLHLSDLRALLLVAAVTAALEVQARDATPLPVAPTAPGSAAPHRGGPLRGGPPRAAAVTAVCLLLFGATLVGAGRSHPRWSTSVVLPVQVGPGNGAAAAYDLDLLSRGLVVPTFAATLDHAHLPAPAGGSVAVSASRLGGAVVVDVTGGTAVQVAQAADAAVEAAAQRVHDLHTPYRLQVQPAPAAHRSPAVSRAAAALLALALLTGAGSLIAGRRRRVRAGRTSAVVHDQALVGAGHR